MTEFRQPYRAIVDPTPQDHIWYRLLAEWNLADSMARGAIEDQIREHPEWGIAVHGDSLSRVPPQNPA